MSSHTPDVPGHVSKSDLRPLSMIGADPPGRRLHAQYGFVESAPDSLGMTLVLDYELESLSDVMTQQRRRPGHSAR